MTILAIYTKEPSFPASDQTPDAQRIQVGNVWVDYTGAVPVQSDLDALQAPILAEQARLAALRTNNRTQAIVAALTTKDDAGLIAAVAQRYPALNGDGIKAVTDIALALATIYRSN